MKQRKSRMLAALLTMCLLLQLTAVTVCGADAAEVYSRAAYDLYALGLLNGYTDGSFGETEPITRAETAALLERVLRPERKTDSGSTFSDVSHEHWACESISAMAGLGLLEGYGDGRFGPEEPVRFEEAAKLLVGLLAEAKGSSVELEYPFGYILRASEWGITDGVDGAAGEAAPRGMVAKMLHNVLYTPLDNGETLAEQKLEGVYYLSPQGDDSHDGTYTRPWKTLAKAAAALRSGESAVLLEGRYTESEAAVFDTDAVKLQGRSGAQIHVSYPAGVGISISASNVVLSGLSFSFASGTEPEETEEMPFITVTGENAVLSGCEFNGFSMPALLRGTGAVMERCAVDNASVGVTVKDAANVRVSGNAFNYPAEAGVVVSGAEQAQLKNNTVYGEAALQAGIRLQDSTAGAVLINNVISVSKDIGEPAGIECAGAADSRLYHNVVTGGYTAVRFVSGTDNRNTVLQNNIFSGCRSDVYDMDEEPDGFVSDYNLYHGTYPMLMEPNSQFGNPYFANALAADWRPGASSPAAGNGVNLQATGLDFTDRSGHAPGSRWHIGAMQTTAAVSAVQAGQTGGLNETFSGVLTGWEAVRGLWEVVDGVYMNTTVTGRNSTMYVESLDWTDFEFSADVKSTTDSITHATGLIFRADKEMKNQYAIRLYANQHLELCLWRDDTFESITTFPCQLEPDTMYNIKVRAEGSTFTFYVDGKEVGKATDISFPQGAIGLYGYAEMCTYDNVRAEPIQ